MTDIYVPRNENINQFIFSSQLGPILGLMRKKKTERLNVDRDDLIKK